MISTTSTKNTTNTTSNNCIIKEDLEGKKTKIKSKKNPFMVYEIIKKI